MTFRDAVWVAAVGAGAWIAATLLLVAALCAITAAADHRAPRSVEEDVIATFHAELEALPEVAEPTRRER